MWGRTFIGLFLGLGVAICLLRALDAWLPFAVDTRLLTGLLAGFVIWGGVMVYAYKFASSWRALGHCGALFGISLVLAFLAGGF